MKKKNIKIFLVSFFAIFMAFYLLVLMPNRTRRAETFLKCFSKQKFYSKVNSPTPDWVDKQIVSDLDFFYDHKISQKSINTTYRTICIKAPNQKQHFVRYRIFKNKLYKYFPADQKPSSRESTLEKALKTLTQVLPLPDVDFIYSKMDGTPEAYMSKDFYYADDPNMQAPIFTKAKLTSAKYAVLIPDHVSLGSSWKDHYTDILEQSEDSLWEYKLSKAFWVGGSHDKPYNLQNFYSRPRIKIAMFSKQYPDLVEAGINKTSCIQLEDKIIEENLLKPFTTIQQQLSYKYLPVIDGYMCTYPGYQWRLVSNSVCFKQMSNEIQWFYAALEPYKHFIPIENDLSDLIDKINWAKNNDAACKEIAEESTDFVLNNLLLEDNYYYLYKVLEKYASLQTFSKNDIGNNLKQDSRWVCIQQRKKANKFLLKHYD